MPAASKIDATRYAVVVLPLVPVIPIDAHLAARIAVERGGEHREREPRVLDHRPRHVDAVRRRLLGDDRGGAALDRLPRERGAVGVLPLERDEHLRRRYRARVVGDRR